MGGFDTDGVQEQLQGLGLLLDGIGIDVGPRRITEARHIHGDDPIMLGQGSVEAAPGIDGLANGMHQHQRFSVPLIHIMDAQGLKGRVFFLLRGERFLFGLRRVLGQGFRGILFIFFRGTGRFCLQGQMDLHKLPHMLRVDKFLYFQRQCHATILLGHGAFSAARKYYKWFPA